MSGHSIKCSGRPSPPSHTLLCLYTLSISGPPGLTRTFTVGHQILLGKGSPHPPSSLARTPQSSLPIFQKGSSWLVHSKTCTIVFLTKGISRGGCTFIFEAVNQHHSRKWGQPTALKHTEVGGGPASCLK